MTHETTEPVQSLHDQIMRLPRDPAEYTSVNMMLAYKDGHRDARHAAAELAAAHEVDAPPSATVAVPDCLRSFVEHEFGQLSVFEDGRTPLYLTEEQYNAIRALLAAAPTPPMTNETKSPVAVPDDNGLLPCPFCGGKAELQQRETESLWSHNQVTWSQVGCCECECVGADCCEDDDGSEAVAHWNTRAAATSAPTPPAQQSPLYTCIGKGGRYEKVGSAKPAGIAHFEHNIGEVIVYRDIESDHLYFRLPLDFNRRMKRIDDGDTAAPEQQASINDNLLDVAVNGITEGERLESLARWLEQQHFRPDVMSIAAADLRALYRRAKDAEQAAQHFAAPEQAEQDAVKVPQELLRRMFKAADLLAGSDQTHHRVFKAADEYSNALSELRALLGGGE